MLDILVMTVAAVVAFIVGARFGRRGSLIILAVSVLAAFALSIYARANLVASGSPGWAYYGPFDRNWPMALGIGCVLAAIVAAIQLAVRKQVAALAIAAVAVLSFFGLFLPYLFVACAGFGACI